MAKITISISAFNEVAAALEKQDKKLGVNVNTITIDKGDFLAPEHDLRMATIRGSVVASAAIAWKGDGSFIEFSDNLFNYVLFGKTSKPATTW